MRRAKLQCEDSPTTHEGEVHSTKGELVPGELHKTRLAAGAGEGCKLILHCVVGSREYMQADTLLFCPKLKMGWEVRGDMKMKGQPNWDSNPVPPS